MVVGPNAGLESIAGRNLRWGRMPGSLNQLERAQAVRTSLFSRFPSTAGVRAHFSTSSSFIFFSLVPHTTPEKQPREQLFLATDLDGFFRFSIPPRGSHSAPLLLPWVFSLFPRFPGERSRLRAGLGFRKAREAVLRSDVETATPVITGELPSEKI